MAVITYPGPNLSEIILSKEGRRWHSVMLVLYLHSQGSCCECALPIKDDVTFVTSLIGWAHSQNDPCILPLMHKLWNVSCKYFRESWPSHNRDLIALAGVIRWHHHRPWPAQRRPTTRANSMSLQHHRTTPRQTQRKLWRSHRNERWGISTNDLFCGITLFSNWSDTFLWKNGMSGCACV